MMEGSKILVIEDEVKLARFLELELKYEGYVVEIANTGKTGLDKFYYFTPDLVVLDLMLPEINGLEVCRKIRRTSDAPIIMLTAKDDVIDKVAGLDSGADDYLTKPFAIEELLARMRVSLKRVARKQVQKTDVLTAGNLSVDTSKRLVKINSETIELTKKEYDLLAYLLANKNIVLTRDQLLNNVWGYDYIGETNIVDVYIRYLRSKIDDAFGKKYIHTVRGVGYIVKDDE